MPDRRDPDSLGVTMVGAAPLEHEVHAAHFFNVFVFVGVEPDNLVAAFFGGLGLGGEGGSVVAGEFSGAGTTGGGPDVVFA